MTNLWEYFKYMTTEEKNAIINYIEFHLVELCELLESRLDQDGIESIYSESLKIVEDINNTLTAQIEISDHENNKKG